MSKEGVQNNTLMVLDSCARSCAATTNVETALKLADACEKLARSYSYLKQIKEEEP